MIDRIIEHYNEVLKEIPEEQIFFIALQGSQNYGLADKDSDVDTKCVVLPSLEEIIFNKEPRSYTMVLDNDEHIDIKDIRLMFGQYRKQNINFVETLFTDEVKVNPSYQEYYDELIKHREEIARYNPTQAIKTMCGMCNEKYHALTHRYPSRAYYIDKYGYDGKQLSHLARVYDFMCKYAEGKPYNECLKPDKNDIDVLLGIKRHTLGINQETAENMADSLLKKATELKNNFVENNKAGVNKDVDEVLDNIQRDILTDHFSQELLLENIEKVR